MLISLPIFLWGAFKKKYLLSLLAVTIFIGVTLLSLRQMAMQDSELHRAIGNSAHLTLQVTTDPVESAPKVSGSYRRTGSYSFLATAIKMDGRQLRVPVRVITDRSVAALLPGQQIEVSAQVRSSKEVRVAALILARDVRVLSGPSAWSRTLGEIRLSFRKLSRGKDSGALIPGMVLGDTSLQSADFKVEMRRSGLAHLTAVSGANFAIVSAFLLWLSQWIIRKLWLRMTLTGVVLIAFISLVRPSPSVLRAAAMAAVILLARGSGRQSDSIPALGFAIAAVILIDPWQSRDPGFALSVLATAGLLLLSPKITEYLQKFLPQRLASALAPPIAAISLCTPVLVAIAGYIAPIAVVANVIAAPLVAPITVIGFIAALLAPWCGAVSSFLIFLIKFPATVIVWVAHWSAGFPVLTIGTGLRGFTLAIVGGILLVALYKRWSRRALIAMVITVLLLASILWFTRWPNGEWSIANCNVGQGDSLVINLGAHRAIALDVGPDPVLEDKCLRALGITEISLLVISHFHADHVGGLTGLLKGRRVGKVWISSNFAPESESKLALGLMRTLSIEQVHQGDKAEISSEVGAIKIRVLWPNYSEQSVSTMPSDGSAINNSSVALMIDAPEFSLFVGGDIEPSVQEVLLPLISKVDIYKVSHHGSRYQSLPFMAALSPRISLISVGQGNPYGHPAVETLAALTRLGSSVYRSDKDGNIAISIKQHKISIKRSGG